MPGAAYDGDLFEALLHGRADGAAHVGFTRGFVGIVWRRAKLLAGRGHRLANGVEHANRILLTSALFDQSAPPGFAILEAGRDGEYFKRVVACRLIVGCCRFALRFAAVEWLFRGRFVFAWSQRMRQIDEAKDSLFFD